MTNVMERPDQAVSSAVTLAVAESPGSGKQYRYSERTIVIVSRADECDPRIDEPGTKQLVSRHYCLFDINPPEIWVRDFGSRSGTHVNGEGIGRRRPAQTPEEGARLKFRERDLVDGDRITLGSIVLQVGMTAVWASAPSVVEDPGSGNQYRYPERRPVIVSRAEDCDQRIDEPGTKQTVSRHHCLQTGVRLNKGQDLVRFEELKALAQTTGSNSGADNGIPPPPNPMRRQARRSWEVVERPNRSAITRGRSRQNRPHASAGNPTPINRLGDIADEESFR